MAIFESPPAGNPPEIIGYVDPWIASPGNTIDVKVKNQKRITFMSPPFNMPQKSLLSLACLAICFAALVTSQLS